MIIRLVLSVPMPYPKGVHHSVFQVGSSIPQSLNLSSYHVSSPDSLSTPGFTDMLLSPIGFSTFLCLTALCCTVSSQYFEVSQLDFSARHPKLPATIYYFAAQTIKDLNADVL